MASTVPLKGQNGTGPKTLKQLCMRVIIPFIDNIVDYGDLPFEVVKPLLERLDDPEQLYQVELYSPHFSQAVDGMADVWRGLISRRFHGWQKLGLDIQDDMHWRDVYYHVKDEVDRVNAEAEATLLAKLSGFQQEKENNTARVATSRMSRMLPGGPGGRSRNANSLSRSIPIPRSRLTPGQAIMRKVKREVVEFNKAMTLTTPKGQLPVRPGQLKKAPEGMIHEYRVASNPVIRFNAPIKKPRTDAVIAARESRLLAIKTAPMPRAPARRVPEDDYDNVSKTVPRKRAVSEGDVDDRFDEIPKKRGRLDNSKASSASPKKFPTRPTTPSEAITSGTKVPKKTGGLLSNKHGTGASSRIYRTPLQASSPEKRVRRETDSVVSLPAKKAASTDKGSPFSLKPLPKLSIEMLEERKESRRIARESSRQSRQFANPEHIRSPRSRSQTPQTPDSSNGSGRSRPQTPVSEPAAAAPAMGRPPTPTLNLRHPAVNMLPSQPRRLPKKKVDIFMRPKKNVH